MKTIQRRLFQNPLDLFILFLPLTLAGGLLHWPALVVFILTCIGIIPMAAYIGKATESLAHFTGPRVGGLLNATLGNAAELIITIAAIRAGLLELVKASITGSILGNLLLVMGFSFVVGGTKHGHQVFDQRNASRNAILLVLAVLAMLIPSLFSQSIGPETSPKVEALSLGVAGIMIVLYILGLLDAAKTGDTPVTQEPAPASVLPKWSIEKSIFILVLATGGIVWLSEVLVGVVEQVVSGLGVSEFFLGIILIPIIGNAAEHLVAVQFAGQNKIDLSVEIAVSSSLQIALLVAPILVFLSLVLGHPLTLIFNPFELLALIAGVIIAALVSMDGESSWLEGVALIAIYLILGLAFFPVSGIAMKNILNGKVLIATLVTASVLLCTSFIYILVKRPAALPPDLTPASAVMTIIPAPSSTPRMLPTTSTPASSTVLSSPTAAPGQIAIGIYVQVATGGDTLRIRAEPGLSNEPLFLAFDSEVFLVTKGPEQADGYTWWYLTASYDVDRAGWAAQDFLTAIPSP